jgi:putative IMPACT (imprinted ancient) family translation regulator
MDFLRGAEYKEKSSKFFGYFARVTSTDEFNEFLAAVKSEHKHLSHAFFAYIVNEKVAGEQISLFDDRIRKEKFSNAGEPSGCGNALLTLLKSRGIENGAIIVVRYFGGILLGSGNLIRAYTAAAKSALEKDVTVLSKFKNPMLQ